MRVSISTLGCRVNSYESDAMCGLLRTAGFTVVSNDEPADICIINTCTVTNTADRKSRQQIARCHRLNPYADIVVVGCWSQLNPDAALKLDGVAAVLGCTGKSRIVEVCERISEGKPACYVDDVMREHSFEEMSAVADGRTRAYLKIQDGCSHFCSYCAIPYARGGIRSRRLESVRRELECLNEFGFTEVVLTGIHLTAYGKDIGSADLADAIDCGNGLNNIKRIRLGSLEPHGLNERLIERITSNPKVCRQFHLSLQSGSTTVLERMRRGYTADDYADIVSSIRSAYGEDGDRVAITTDIIAGFPMETAAEHAETLAFMERIGFARVHVFPYSKRSKTTAAQLTGQLTNAEKAARAAELIQKARELEHIFAARFIGREETMLVESERNGHMEGFINSYVRARCKTGSPNELVKINITKVEEDENGELYLL